MTGQASHERIAVSLVTGFLGSGKTTLIAALLRQPGMAGTAVIVNEFGAVGIDDAIFAQSVAPTMSCCSPMDVSAAPPATTFRRGSGRWRGAPTAARGGSSSRPPGSPTRCRCCSG